MKIRDRKNDGTNDVCSYWYQFVWLVFRRKRIKLRHYLKYSKSWLLKKVMMLSIIDRQVENESSDFFATWYKISVLVELIRLSGIIPVGKSDNDHVFFFHLNFNCYF